MLKIHIQLFAEPEGGAPAEPAANPEGAKTFSEDYVKALRGESAGYRTRAKAAENALREVFGLSEAEALGDLSARLSNYRAAQNRAQNEAVQKANDRLVGAAIRSLDGYDTKLLEKLIDRSKITVGDDGAVNGLKEAAEAVAAEYPAVKKVADPAGGTGSKGNFPRSRGAEEDFPSREKILKMPYPERIALYKRDPQKFNEAMKG